MKKLLSSILVLLFVISILASLSNDIKTAARNVGYSHQFAAIIPLPPPPPPPPKGC